MLSNQWTQNTAIAVEATITLDLVTTVIKKLGVNECGRLKVCTDYKMVSDLLALDRIKASQLALEGRVFISKITQIEKECEIEFEHIHVRAKNDNDESGCSHEKILTLEYDNIATEVLLKCTNDAMNDNIKFRVNVSLWHEERHCDMKLIKIIKKIDSLKRLEEHFQDKQGENGG